MNYKKIDEFTAVVTGGTPSTEKQEYWEGGDIPWLQSGCCQNCDVESAEKYITQEGYNNSSAKMMPADTVMIALTGATAGKVGYLRFQACGNQSITGILPCDSMDQRFIFYYLLSQRDKILADCIGGAQPHISQGYVKNILVPVPSIDEQKIIVKHLSIVSSIIKKRKQEIAMFDDLIKARFVEMFGDPGDNPMGWPVVNINEVIGGKVSNGFFAKRDDYCDNGNVQVLGVVNVVNRMYSGIEDLPKTNGTSADIAKYSVKYGDMLFCRSSLVAEGIGKASIVPENTDDNVLFECHVIRLPLDLGKCVPEFMQALSTTDYFRRQIIAQSKTATMTTIGQDGILKSSIILPPIEKQREFYNFVKQVDKSKVAVQKALDEAQLLFDSLMQKYFG